MKTVVCILLIVIGFSCSKEVIKPVDVERVVTVTEIVKEVDTVYLDSIIIVVDTVFVDSIVTVTVTKTIVERDTIVVRDTVRIEGPPVVIRDTVIVNGAVFQVREEFMPFVDGFIRDAKRYGWGDIPKNNLILEFSELNEITSPDHSSISYKYGNQNVAKVHWILDSQYWLVPIYREMAHLLINKPYLPDTADDIMNPTFSARNITGAPHDDEKRERYIKQLFER